MTEAPQQTEEIEEIDIVDFLEMTDRRLIVFAIAIKGTELPKHEREALIDFIGFIRTELYEMNDKLTDQDKAKRARGEPRIERIFCAGREP